MPQHNGSQPNDTQHKETRNNDTKLNDTLQKRVTVTLSIMMLTITTKKHSVTLQIDDTQNNNKEE